jgi:pyruvate,water dikinase
LLNHCSIVARELRVPAVVGVRQATRRIREGAVITIDGGLGLIRVEEDEAGAVGSPSPGDRLRRRED